MSLQKITKSSNSTGYGFILGKPDSYDVSKKYPLIIFLHGMGGIGDGEGGLDLLMGGELPKVMQTALKNYEFLLLAPQIGSTNYNGNEVDAMIKYATDNLAVDLDRIHLTGLSLGGGGTLHYISSSAARAAKLATAIPVATTYITGNYKYVADANLPVWAFHNLKDTNGGTPVAATNYAVTAINAYSGFPAVKTLFNATGHGGWGEAYGEAPPIAINGEGLIFPTVNVYQWMLMNTKDRPVAVPGQQNSGNLVASAGGDVTTSSQTYELNGSGSQNFKTASWSIISVPSGVNQWDSGAIFPGGSGWHIIKAFFPKPGSYTFRLTVKDDKGGIAYDDVTITYSSTGTSSTTTTTSSTLLPTKTELSRTWIAKLSKFVYVYDDGSTEIK